MTFMNITYHGKCPNQTIGESIIYFRINVKRDGNKINLR